eukprot:1037049-Pelagomonas_calceolata.AAC.5
MLHSPGLLSDTSPGGKRGELEEHALLQWQGCKKPRKVDTDAKLHRQAMAASRREQSALERKSTMALWPLGREPEQKEPCKDVQSRKSYFLGARRAPCCCFILLSKPA